MRCLTFEIILHKRQSIFYASVTPRQKGPETKEKTKKLTQELSCSIHVNYGTEDIREQKTKL